MSDDDAAPTREAYERLREMNRINNDWGLRLHAALTELRECATEAPADLLERVDELLAEE